MSDWTTTRPEPVEVRLTDRRTMRGAVHLAAIARHHNGAETPADFLNREGERFFALIVDDRRPIFIARQQVLFLQVDHPDWLDPDRANAALRVEIDVELDDGTSLEGAVLMELPSDQPRVLDFLNSVPQFFTLWTGETVRVLNRDHVRAASLHLDGKRGAA